VAFEGESVRACLLLDARVQLQVGEFREPLARTADQVMMMLALAELIPHAPVLERDPTQQVKLVKELHGPKHRRAADSRKRFQQFLHGERRPGRFDSLQDRTARSSGTKPDGIEASICYFGKAHVTMLANSAIAAPRAS